jgi:outer membrane protein OmpA-like peptidoglycan-associated protein
MKIAYRLFLVLLISAFLFSCSEKKAGIEGKLLNGLGKPISGVTVTFKQVQQSKGYEQFETKTLTNGAFRIDGVMPATEYIITPVSDNWKTKVTTKITTLSDGQALVLSNPIVIRFNALKDGTIVDTKTDLQWLILGIPDLNSSNVLNAVKNIKEGGFTDWRLPTKAELLELQETPAAPVTQPETGLVQKTCCAWVTEPNSENVEWKFYVDDDNDVWSSSKVSPNDRIIIVRNYIPTAPSTQTPAAAIPANAVPAIAASSAKQSPSAKVKTAQPDNSIGDSMTIQFAMNKSIISPEELSKLKAFYARIKGKKGTIVIKGNSASDGDVTDNFKISGDRALSVKAMLHRLGLSKIVNVKIAALSDTKPIAENTTEAGRILNRRADITFIPE